MGIRKEKLMSKAAPMYIYATEMVSRYYSKIGVRDKNVLAVSGSGDQVLNAYFLGAKKVVGFDLNARSEHITRLKMAAIKELNYKEFLRFFGEQKVNVGFNFTLYKKIRKSLEKNALYFFDRLYKIHNFKGNKLAKSEYFRQRRDVPSLIKEINNYLKDEKSYSKLKRIPEVEDYKFLRSDIKDIASNKKLSIEKFDVINLSNVPNYFVDKLEKQNVKDPIKYFFNNVLLKLRKKLSDKGKIFSYSYSPWIYPNRIAPNFPTASKNSSIKRIASQKGFKVTQKRLKGLNKGTLDKIIILEKALL